MFQIDGLNVCLQYLALVGVDSGKVTSKGQWSPIQIFIFCNFCNEYVTCLLFILFSVFSIGSSNGYLFLIIYSYSMPMALSRIYDFRLYLWRMFELLRCLSSIAL